MRVLIVGGGAREHALAWAFSRSAKKPVLFCAPGNAGIAALATRLPIGVDEPRKIAEAARREKIDLVVVGPEAPLCGLADLLIAEGIAVFGPTRAAAEIEGSKAYCKALLRRHEIPTATFGTFSMLPEAELFIDSQPSDVQLVVKADGLMAGKGVHICANAAAAKHAARELLKHPGASIVVEEFLVGREASLMALVVDEEVVPLPAAEDHKTIFDGDRGPMTGGMGVVCPTPVVDEITARHVLDSIMRPTAKAMCAEGRPFRGLLFAGLMIGPSGPKVLEFNCRFGDPETEAVLVRLAEGERGDLLTALHAVAHGHAPRPLAVDDVASTTVVMAHAGYPGPLAPPVAITGLAEASSIPGVVVFHGGTQQDGDRIVTAGGRVLAVTAVGSDVGEARSRAYAAVACIDMPGSQHRRDIGARLPSAASHLE